MERRTAGCELGTLADWTCDFQFPLLADCSRTLHLRIQVTENPESERSASNTYTSIVLVEVLDARDIRPSLHSYFVRRVDFKCYEALVLCHKLTKDAGYARHVNAKFNHDRSVPLDTSLHSHTGQDRRHAVLPPIACFSAQRTLGMGVLLLYVRLPRFALLHR